MSGKGRGLRSNRLLEVRRLAWGALLLPAMLLVGTAPAWASMRLVSTSSTGVQGNQESILPSVAAGGRYVVFVSTASNLVSGDTNLHRDIFRKDLETGETVRVSVDASGAQSNGLSYSPSVSPDGTYATFWSQATNLVAGDTNGAADVFRKDLQTGQILRVSVDTDGTQANGGSSGSAMTPDGRYVAFVSSATNLVSGDTNGVSDVFRKDLVTGETVRASVATDGTQANAGSLRVSISSDGRYVAFDSGASTLVAGDTNGWDDVFRKDLVTGEIVRVSVDSFGGEGNSNSGGVSMTPDGRYVAFFSYASDLVGGDTNGVSDVFRKDLQTGETVRVSLDAQGAEGNAECPYASISSDGRYVAFQSSASNLVAGDTNVWPDIFRKDLQSGRIVLLSVNASGEGENSYSQAPSISADGRRVAFQSYASNLVAVDTNGFQDVFATDVNTAGDDFASTGQGLPVTIPVLLNDTDADGDPLFVESVSAPASVVVNPDGTVTYTPPLNFFGLDTFTYVVTDGNGGSAVGIVRVDVASSLTFGKPTKASSTRKGGYISAYAVDGTIETRWMSAKSSTPQYLQVDLGSKHSISTARIAWYGNYYATTFAMQISDNGRNWTTLPPQTSVGGITEFDFPVMTRFVRINCTAANDPLYYGVAELGLYP